MSETLMLRTVLSDSDFTKLSQLIDKQLGIKMPYSKKVMLESRLQKRLKALHLSNFSEYCSYLFSDDGRYNEWTQFFNVVTTNKTDFFRENSHFEFMTEKLLPRLYSEGQRELSIWSCASSSGEEPYTIMITMEEFREKHPDLRYRIYASDISTKVLDEAISAVYTEIDVDIIPFDIRRKYFLRGKKDNNNLYKVKKEYRDKMQFYQFNLMDKDYHSVLGYPFDIVFCRNVLIYFDRFRQEEILTKITMKMKTGGTLFLGHSESMAGMNLKLKALTTSVYQKELRE